MRKAFKIALYAAAACCAIIIAAVIALRVYFPPEKLKSIAVAQLSKQLRRQVRIESVSLGIGKLSIKNMAVSEDPDFSRGEMLSAESISVSIRLKPLLRKELQISSLGMEGVKLAVTRDKKGNFNFPEFAKQPAPPAKPAAHAPEQPARRMTFAVSKLSLKNCEAVFKDEKSNTAVKIRNLSLNAKNIALDKPFPVSANFNAEYKAPALALNIALDTDLVFNAANADLSKAALTVEKLKLKTGKITSEASADIKNLLLPEGSLKLKTAPFNTNELKAFNITAPANILLPQTFSSLKFKLSGSGLNVSSCAFTSGPLALTGTGSLDWSAKSPRYDFNFDIAANLPEMESGMLKRLSPRIPRGYIVPQLGIKAKLRAASPADLEIYSASVKSALLSAAFHGKAAARGSVSVWGINIDTFTVTLGKLDRYAPQLKQYAFNGSISGKADIGCMPKLMYSVTAKLTDVKAVYEAFTVSDLNGTLFAPSKNNIQFRDFYGKLNGSDFKASGAFNMDKQPAKAAIALDITSLDLAPFAAAPAKPAGPKQPTGKKTAAAPQDLFALDLDLHANAGRITHPNFEGKDASVYCKLQNITPALDKLNGSASLRVNGGHIKDIASAVKDNRFARIFLMPIAILQKASRVVKLQALPNFDDISYSLIEGDYRFDQGVMRIIKSNLDSTAAYVSAEGKANLATEALDMKITAKLAGALAKAMPAPIVIKVDGTISSPSAKADIKSILKSPEAGKAIQQGIDEGKKLLKNLFH